MDPKMYWHLEWTPKFVDTNSGPKSCYLIFFYAKYIVSLDDLLYQLYWFWLRSCRCHMRALGQTSCSQPLIVVVVVAVNFGWSARRVNSMQAYSQRINKCFFALCLNTRDREWSKECLRRQLKLRPASKNAFCLHTMWDPDRTKATKVGDKIFVNGHQLMI